MLQKSLSGASLALVFAIAPLNAQEATTSDASGSSATVTTEEVTTVETSETESVESSSFFLPGGYGYLPETIVPGTGLYSRPPLEIFLNTEIGYDDNIYGSSGDPGAPDKKGSGTTQATLGLNLLYNGPRTFLSVGGDAGAIYYWDRDGDNVSPTGNLNLAFAHRATDRLSFSSRISTGYYTQPNVWISGVPRSNTGDYFTFRGYFDATYRWTPLFSTVTTLGFGSQIYRESYADVFDSVDYSIGQQFRWVLTPRFTGVVDLRFSQSFYYNDGNRDTNTEVASLGFDWLMTPRLTSTLRAGATWRQYELDGASDQVAPFVETGLGYRFGHGSMLHWTARYGFEDGNWDYQQTEAIRTGLSVSQTITSRLSASLGLYYIYEFRDQLLPNQPAVDDQQIVDVSARLNYAITRSFSIYGGYNHTQVITDSSFNEYSRNRYTLGLSYRF